MENNMVAFIGLDNYDIIMYLSRILANLGKKVLLLDYSDTNALAACIPVPEGLDICVDFISNRDVSITKMPFEEEFIQEYDTIIIDFGFHPVEDIILRCDQLVYGTDLQRYHVDKLAALPDYISGKQQLVIRDTVSCKINKRYISCLLKKSIDEEDIYEFDQDVLDTKYRVLIQYDTLFEFTRITKEMKKYLINTLQDLYPTLEKEIIEAYNKAKKGR